MSGCDLPSSGWRGKDCLLVSVSRVYVCDSVSLKGVERMQGGLSGIVLQTGPWELCLHEVPLAAM
jgi:hypothetical protein